jgi:hypothetical protein
MFLMLVDVMIRYFENVICGSYLAKILWIIEIVSTLNKKVHDDDSVLIHLQVGGDDESGKRQTALIATEFCAEDRKSVISNSILPAKSAT